MSLIIYPTGRCFDDTMEFIEALIDNRGGLPVGNSRERVTRHGLYLVHGICIAGPRPPGFDAAMAEGQPYAHAWIEQGERVFHSGMLMRRRAFFQFDRAKYYAEHQITDFTKYTLRQVNQMNERHLTYGPWEERYLALCRKRKTASERMSHPSGTCASCGDGFVLVSKGRCSSCWRREEGIVQRGGRNVVAVYEKTDAPLVSEEPYGPPPPPQV